MIKLLVAALALAATASVGSAARPSKNIVELAESVKDLSTLVSAVVAGNLTSALEAKGPYTVFAPTNEAFAKLPAATLKHLLDPANIKELQAILEYHVIAGAAVYSKDLKTYQKVKTLEGEEVDITKWDGKVFVNHNSRVIAADNEASNGVVHIIDTVLLPPSTPSPSPSPSPKSSPPSTKNIVGLAESVKDLSTLVSAVVAANLTAALEAKGPYTVFAPTNEAFAKLPAATLKHLLDPKNIKELQALLEYHVIAGAAVMSKDLKSYQKVKTLEGDEVEVIKTSHGSIIVNRDAYVTAADNEASNGVVHIINNVLMPPTPAAAPAPAPKATKNIVALAQSVKDLSTLVTAVVAANLTSALEAKGPYTVFAPTNEAFAKLPAAYLKHLLDPKNIKELQAILEYHVIAGAAVYSKDLKFVNRVKTLDQGEEVIIVKDYRSGAVTVNYKSHVTAADNAATNGVVHIIDEVLIPYH